MRSNRWAYMRAPNYNPPNDDCPQCTSPSKTYYLGGKTVTKEDEAPEAVHRWKCEHGHIWTVTEATPPR